MSDKSETLKRNNLPEIPSEFIEPYLVAFMGTILQFIASARTEEEQEKNNYGWTVDEVKTWVKGVEMFVSWTCGIHSRLAMSNQCDRFTRIDNDELKKMCKKIELSMFEEED